MIVPYAPGGGSDIVARIVEGLTTNGLSTIAVRRERER
jgi:tripartite-type tricarboxylate transporter receptor subunit TctC